MAWPDLTVLGRRAPVAGPGARRPARWLTPTDISLGLDAAVAVGDDRSQQESTGRIDPERWTHGSAAQRQMCFTTEYEPGHAARCDTFAPGPSDRRAGSGRRQQHQVPPSPTHQRPGAPNRRMVGRPARLLGCLIVVFVSVVIGAVVRRR